MALSASSLRAQAPARGGLRRGLMGPAPATARRWPALRVKAAGSQADDPNAAFVHVLPAAEFEAYVASGFCIVDCFTDWCGPCKLIAPKYYELAAQTHAAGAPLRFAKFDCQSDTRRSSALAIKALPSFLAFHNGVEVGRMTGSKRDELEKFVATHAAAAAAAVSVVAA